MNGWDILNKITSGDYKLVNPNTKGGQYKRNTEQNLVVRECRHGDWVDLLKYGVPTSIVAWMIINSTMAAYNRFILKPKYEHEEKMKELENKAILSERMETIHEIDHAEDANVIGFRPNKE